MRIQSSHCEVRDHSALLANLDHALLLHLALGFHCRVYDFGSRRKRWTGEGYTSPPDVFTSPTAHHTALSCCCMPPYVTPPFCYPKTTSSTFFPTPAVNSSCPLPSGGVSKSRATPSRSSGGCRLHASRSCMGMMRGPTSTRLSPVCPRCPGILSN